MLLLLMACGPGVSPDVAKTLIEEQAASNPTGRLGIELLGRSTWSEAPMFDPSCVANQNLAYPDDPRDRPAGKKNTQRITPTYENQRRITAATDTGWCVLMGEGLQAPVSDPVVGQLDDGSKAWMVPVSFSMSAASPWWQCLDNDFTNRTVAVVTDEAGNAEIRRSSAVFTESACPHPMPGSERRTRAPGSSRRRRPPRRTSSR